MRSQGVHRFGLDDFVLIKDSRYRRCVEFAPRSNGRDPESAPTENSPWSRAR